MSIRAQTDRSRSFAAPDHYHQLRQPGRPSRQRPPARTLRRTRSPTASTTTTPKLRNVTYRQSDGRFCLIDFEFAHHPPRRVKHPIMDSPPNEPASHRLQWFGRTDRGHVRKNNEDTFLALQFDGREVHYLGKIGEAPTGNADFVFAVSGRNGRRQGGGARQPDHGG